jgi:signal transduction histidine kinase
MLIDTQTLLLTVGLLYLLLPSSTWLVLLKQRTPQVDLWCLGGLIGGGGVVLFSLRGTLPDLMAYPLANILIMVSFVLRIRSLHLDLEGNARGEARWLVSPAGLTALMLIYVAGYLPLYAGEHHQWLALWTRCLTVLFCGWLVWLAARLAITLRSRNAAAIAAVYGLFALAMLVVTVLTLLGASSMVQPAARPEFGVLGALLALTSIIGHFSYMGLALEHTARTRIRLISENARAEVLRAQAEVLALSDRRRTLGLLSNSLSHDIRQPLTTVSIIAQLLRRSLASQQTAGRGPNSEALTGLLDNMVTNVRRATTLIDQIRSFVRPTATAVQEFDVHDYVHTVLALLKQTLMSRHIEVITELPSAPVLLLSNPLHVAQALLHAVHGAAESQIDPGKTPALTIRLRLIASPQQVLITIEDDGLYDSTTLPGKLDAALASSNSRQFGLLIASRLIEALGGTLDVSQGADTGTMTRIALPRH